MLCVGKATTIAERSFTGTANVAMLKDDSVGTIPTAAACRCFGANWAGSVEKSFILRQRALLLTGTLGAWLLLSGSTLEPLLAQLIGSGLLLTGLSGYLGALGLHPADFGCLLGAFCEPLGCPGVPASRL